MRWWVLQLHGTIACVKLYWLTPYCTLQNFERRLAATFIFFVDLDPKSVILGHDCSLTDVVVLILSEMTSMNAVKI